MEKILYYEAHIILDPGDTDKKVGDMVTEATLCEDEDEKIKLLGKAHDAISEQQRSREEHWVRKIDEHYVEPSLLYCGMAHLDNSAPYLIGNELLLPPLLKVKVFCWNFHCFSLVQPFPAGINTDKPV